MAKVKFTEFQSAVARAAITEPRPEHIELRTYHGKDTFRVGAVSVDGGPLVYADLSTDEPSVELFVWDEATETELDRLWFERTPNSGKRDTDAGSNDAMRLVVRLIGLADERQT